MYGGGRRRYFFFKARTLIDVGSLLPLIIDQCFKSMGRESLGFGLLFVRYASLPYDNHGSNLS